MNNHEELYEELTNDVDPRVKISFDHIRIACDEILKVGGKLNYSTVGKWCERMFALRDNDEKIVKSGQPTVKTIQQDRFNYKAYIDARKAQPNKNSHIAALTGKMDDSNYPAPNLDHSTKLHINNLRSEVKRLKRDLNIVETRFTEMQKSQPVELTKLLSYASANQEGAPLDALMAPQITQVVNDDALSALHFLLFELDQTGIVKRMPVDTSQPQSTWVNSVTMKPIISISQYLALCDFWKTLQ